MEYVRNTICGDDDDDDGDGGDFPVDNGHDDVGDAGDKDACFQSDGIQFFIKPLLLQGLLQLRIVMMMINLVNRIDDEGNNQLDYNNNSSSYNNNNEVKVLILCYLVPFNPSTNKKSQLFEVKEADTDASAAEDDDGDGGGGGDDDAYNISNEYYTTKS